ncbi:MAG: acetamidase/formamidase family protein [Thermoplasmata archaeon]|nr:acetamidase/formamidase family protein [Thermoplasmata archaeon]
MSIRSGDEVVVRVPDSSTGQLGPNSTRADLLRLDLDRVDAAVGPIEVDGARPGDSLAIEILEIQPGAWGWSGVFRQFGLLRDRFDDDLVIWSVGASDAVPATGFLRGVRIPLAPMLGWIGVAPPSGDLGMIPPQVFGGNLDNRLHREGTVLELPVQRPGAGLLIGDPHAAQGDGEVCGTGIETEATVRLRVELRRGRKLRGPRATTRGASRPEGPFLVSEGVGPDPIHAARAATEDMIEVLQEVGATAAEAYLLLSVAGHLRWSEIVDEPNYVVSMLFPTALSDQLRSAPAPQGVKPPAGSRTPEGER